MASSSSNQDPIVAQIRYAESLGVVSKQLGRLYDLKEENEQQYFESYFTGFLHDTANRFSRIEALLNCNMVDFSNVAKESLKIIGSAATIGVVRVTEACRHLQWAADNHSKDGCVQSLDVVKRELATVRPHLDAIVQIERRTVF